MLKRPDLCTSISKSSSVVIFIQVSYDEGLLAEIAGETDPDKKILLELKNNLVHNEKKYTTAMREIGSLQAEISRLQARNSVIGNPDIETVKQPSSLNFCSFIFFGCYKQMYI